MPRFGMDVVLAHPEGYQLIPDVVAKAGVFAKENGGSFKVVNFMDEAFAGADVVYPKSWAPITSWKSAPSCCAGTTPRGSRSWRRPASRKRRVQGLGVHRG